LPLLCIGQGPGIGCYDRSSLNIKNFFLEISFPLPFILPFFVFGYFVGNLTMASANLLAGVMKTKVLLFQISALVKTVILNAALVLSVMDGTHFAQIPEDSTTT
jgi:hypothetical protein